MAAEARREAAVAKRLEKRAAASTRSNGMPGCCAASLAGCAHQAQRVGSVWQTHSQTLTATTNTVLQVVMSKSWHATIVGYLLPYLLGLPEKDKFDCAATFGIFTGFCVLGTVALAMMAIARSPGHTIPPLIGMLVGWSFKDALTTCHTGSIQWMLAQLTSAIGEANLERSGVVFRDEEGKLELELPVFDWFFAIVATTGAAFIIHAVGVQRERKAKHKQLALEAKAFESSPYASPSQRTSAARTLSMQVDEKITTTQLLILDRMAPLLSTGLGLGVAATWDLAFGATNKLDAYSMFFQEQLTAAAADAGSGSGTHDLWVRLPSPLSLRIYWAFLVNTMLALVALKLREAQEHFKGNLERAQKREAEARIERGCRLLSVQVRKLQRVVRRWRMQQALSGKKRVGSAKALAKVGGSQPWLNWLSDGKETEGATEGEDAAEAFDAQGYVGFVADRVIETHAGGIQTVSELRVTALAFALAVFDKILLLLDRTMGFVVGWGWYDALIAAFGGFSRASNQTGVWGSFIVALSASVISIGWIAILGKAPVAQSESVREKQANTFLANALGLMQGWAWSDVVAAFFTALTRWVHRPLWDLLATSGLTLAMTVAVYSYRQVAAGAWSCRCCGGRVAPAKEMV